MKMYFKPVFLFNDNENGNLDPPDWAGSLIGGDESGKEVVVNSVSNGVDFAAPAPEQSALESVFAPETPGN